MSADEPIDRRDDERSRDPAPSADDKDRREATPRAGGEDDRPEESEEVRDASPLARFFFLKTTFAILLVAVLLVGGIFAYGMLTKESLPDLDIPRATITTTWPGADARSIEEQVTDNIEDELTSLSGVRSIDSASYDSFSVISVEFEASVNSETAMAELRAAVSDAEAELPDAAEQPTVTQVTVDDRPILTLALTGTVDARTLSQLGRDVQDRLERITGVDEVTLGGEREEIVQVLLQPERMLALGVSATAVRDAITSANVEQPFGEITSAAIGAVVRLEGRFRDLDDLRALPVARQQQGNVAARAVRLDEVAKVRRTIEREQTRAAFTSGGKPYVQALEVSITKSPGSDTVEVVDQVTTIIREMRAGSTWPQGVQDVMVQDGAADIWSSLSKVFVSGLQSMAIVFIILFITIAWREALITGLSIPITFTGVLLLLLLMGQTLNELVIIGMVIALVLIIDVFIIMMEGMHDEIYVQKATFGQAVLRTFKRYGKPAFAAQITTILALMPLMSIGGVAGTFIRILPLTTILCLVIAFALALFAAMPMARWLLKPPAESEDGEAKESRADRVTRQAMDWLEGWNTRHVLPSRRRAKIWVFGAFGVFALSLVAFTQTRVELFPMTDAEQLGINIDLPPTTPLAETQTVADAVGDILRRKPYLKNTVMLTGRRSPFASGSVAGQLQPDVAENFIGFSSIFTDRGDREGVSYELAEELRGELASWLRTNVAGAVLQVVPQQSSPTPGDPVEIEIAGPDIDTLRRLSRQVQAALREGGGVTDVRDNIVLNPEIGVRPDREAADFFGIAHGDLAGQLRAAFSSDEIGDFGTGPAEDDIEIRLGTEWPSNPGEAGPPRDLSELATIRAFTAQGRPVAMSQLIKPGMGEGPVAISHAGGERALTVMARNQGRTVTEIVGDFEPKLEKMKADWPEGYSYTVGGEAADTGETLGSAGIALIVAVMLMMGVLVVMFDSFAQALIIVATMPLAIIGAFIGFFMFGLSFSFYAMIGLVSLIGIVINTGIIMVDTMNQELAGGASVTEAAAAGSARRLRPVVTTSVTTIIGLIPLAISSDAYRPLTLVIIFGLISATILALFVVPALYLLLTKDENAREPALD